MRCFIAVLYGDESHKESSQYFLRVTIGADKKRHETRSDLMLATCVGGEYVPVRVGRAGRGWEAGIADLSSCGRWRSASSVSLPFTAR